MRAPSVSQATRAAYLYQCAGAYREIARPLADLCHNFCFAKDGLGLPHRSKRVAWNSGAYSAAMA
jgi:hypothetical protein